MSLIYLTICWWSKKKIDVDHHGHVCTLTNVSNSLLGVWKNYIPHLLDMKDTFLHIRQKHVSFQFTLLFISHEEEDRRGRFRNNLNGLRRARKNMNIQWWVKEKQKFGVFSIWRRNGQTKLLAQLPKLAWINVSFGITLQKIECSLHTVSSKSYSELSLLLVLLPFCKGSYPFTLILPFSKSNTRIPIKSRNKTCTNTKFAWCGFPLSIYT